MEVGGSGWAHKARRLLFWSPSPTEKHMVVLSHFKSQLHATFSKGHSLTTLSKIIFHHPNSSPPHHVVFCMAFFFLQLTAFIYLLIFFVSLYYYEESPSGQGNDLFCLFPYLQLSASGVNTASTQ